MEGGNIKVTQYKSYTVQKLYNAKVIQRKRYTVKSYTTIKLYNYIVIIRQRKRYDIYKQRSQSEHHSSM